MVRHLGEQASSLRPADFATLFYALGLFAVNPGPRLLGRFVPAAIACLDQWGPRELCNTFWGLGLIVSGGAVCACVCVCVCV